ncbi:MAG: histidine phosphatase family protein [bacterium]|nr:histidine phosphatase family protein [bacterium]
MPRRLYLVRHGETEANRLKIIEGRGAGFPEYGAPLNHTGLSQAYLLGRALAEVNLSHIYMSPAKRARETADQICLWNEAIWIKANKVPLKRSITPDLLEMNFGIIEGLNGNKAREKYPDFFKTYHEKPSQTVFSEGESVVGAYNRIGLALSEILAAHTFGGNILIVSHGASLTLIFICIFKLDLDTMFHAIRHHNCGLSIIEWEKPGVPKIVCMNDISHLKSEHDQMIK